VRYEQLRESKEHMDDGRRRRDCEDEGEEGGRRSSTHSIRLCQRDEGEMFEFGDLLRC